MNLSLYVITRINEDGSHGANFDEAAGFVVAAGDTVEARWLAADQPGDEGAHVWMDPTLTECHLVGEALPEQVAGILMRDFHSA
jgi:hypothetical protein